MKKIVLLVLFLTLFFNGYSQYFNRRYSLSNAEIGADLVPCDSGYYFMSYTTDFHTIGVLLGKVDYIGSPLWIKNLSDPSPYSNSIGAIGGLAYYDSSSLFFAGATNLNTNHWLTKLYKLNLAGDTIFTKTFGDSIAFIGRQALKSMDGGFYVLVDAFVPNHSDDIEIMRLDSNGTLLWYRSYGGLQYDNCISMTRTFDGGFVMAGVTDSYGVNANTQCSNGICMKIDSSGNKLWQTVLGGNYADGFWSVIQCHDSTLAMAGYYTNFDPSVNTSCDNGSNWPWMVKLDAGGNVLWDKKFGNSIYSTALRNIIEVNNGDLVAVGLLGSDTTQRGDGLLIRTNSNGDSLLYNLYSNLSGNNSFNDLYSIIQTQDQGFLAIGTVHPLPPDTGTQDMWILKLDSNGCEISNCLTNGISSIQERETIFVYPNPSSGVFNLAISDEPVEQIEIIDALGRVIKSSTGKTTVIDLSQETNGIYFYRIKKAGKVYTGKLMKV